MGNLGLYKRIYNPKLANLDLSLTLYHYQTSECLPKKKTALLT